MDKRNYSAAYNLIKAAIVCGVTVAVCLAAYRYDNKYTSPGPSAQNGVLTYDSRTMHEYPAVFLINGWEYYGGVLLTPDDFNSARPVPDKYIYVGRYGGFEAGDKNASPHGSASYRLSILLSDDIRRYTLWLPEIYSSYRLYINGKPAAETGNPEPADYVPATGDRPVSVEAGGVVEILLAVSDFSNFYSGMVYPPLFGQPEAVAALVNSRLVFRCILCAIALIIGFASALVGAVSRKNTAALLYSLLCLFFICYIGYPITRTFVTGFQPMYTMELFSYNALLLVVMLLAKKVCGANDWPGYIFIAYGGFMCVAAIILALLIPAGNLRIMTGYSALIDIYQWSTAVYVTTTAALSVQRGTARLYGLLYGFLAFDTSLVMDRLLRLHEPIVTGWFVELAGFALVMCFGVVITREVALRYRDAAALDERAKGAERLYLSQQSYYMALRREMDDTRKMRHDMRHHFMMIDRLVKTRQYEKLSEYAQECVVAAEDAEPVAEFCPIDVINVLTWHYNGIARQNGIQLDIRYDTGVAAGDSALTQAPRSAQITDSDLCCLYSNLMENAVEACLRSETCNRFIRVAVARPAPFGLSIRIWNNADSGVHKEGGAFISTKGDGRRDGYGVPSIKSIVDKYGGAADFKWDENKKVFESTVTVNA